MCPKQAFATKVAASNKENLLLAAKIQIQFQSCKNKEGRGAYVNSHAWMNPV
jgi:hypothetical protein